MDLFINNLKLQLNKPLPGKSAQLLMIPAEYGFKIKSREGYHPKLSAVLILLFPFHNSIFTILIERAVYPGIHSGQIAFPGGKLEDSDPNLEYTALRETYEEIGVPMEKVNIIGKLTDVYIHPSNYLVSPYIGFLRFTPNFLINEQEVQQVVKMDILNCDLIVKAHKIITHSNGLNLNTPFYSIEGFTIWGATAMIISELLEVVKEVQKIHGTT